MAKKVKKNEELFPKSSEAKKQEETDKQENLGVQFNLTPEKQKEICLVIESMVEDCKNSRSGLIDKWRKGIDLYEGVRKPKNKPWPGASNISTMVTTVACDLLHAKLFPMVWNAETIHWQGREKHDVETAENIRHMMSFVVSEPEMDLEPLVDDSLQTLIVDGTLIVKLSWRPYWTYVTRLIPKITPQAILTGKEEYDVQYDYVRREKCYAELKPLERVYFPLDATDDEFIIEEAYYTLSHLRKMKKDGVVFSGADINAVEAAMDILPEFGGTSKARSDAEGTTTVNTRKEAYKLKCYEAYMKHDLLKDGDRKECVFLVVANSGVYQYLSGKPLHAVSRIGRRPWIIAPFLRRPGRRYGKSIPELTMNLHEELDAIHNQRIDAGNMAIAPYFFFRSASGQQPTNITVGPATGIPLDEPERDIKYPSFPGYGLQVSFQEEKLVNELLERLTFLTPAMMGKELASRPTVRGTLAVMSQGEQKFSLLARRMQGIISKMLTQIKQIYEENLPPEMQARILGKEGNPIFANLAPETIAGQYDCKMQLDLTAGSLGAERELNAILFQTMAMDPYVTQNPAYGWEIRADYLKGLNKKNVERFIGPRPETEMQQGDAEDELHQIAQGLTVMPKMGQDHVAHLGTHLRQRDMAIYKSMPAEHKALFNKHIMETKIMYAEEMQNRMVMSAQAGRAGGNEGFGATEGSPGTSGMGLFQTKGSPGPVQPGGQPGVPVAPQARAGQPAAGAS